MQEISVNQAEYQRRWLAVCGYFAGIETRNPGQAKNIAPLIFNLIGNQIDFTPDNLKKSRIFLNAGLDLIGDQLKLCGIKGFNLKLQGQDSLYKSQALGLLKQKKGIVLPKTKEELFSVLNVPDDLRTVIESELNLFSKVIQEVAEIGLPGEAIVGILFVDTLVGKNPKFTSEFLREFFKEKLGETNFPEVIELFNKWIQFGRMSLRVKK